MKRLIPLAFLAPLPTYAAEIWCMPDRVCIPGSCDVQITEDSAIRMTHPASVAPSMQSHGETIAMSKTHEAERISQWTGVNSQGEHEMLQLDRKRMRFTYSIGGEFVQFVGRELRYKSVGKCEIQ